MENEGIMLYCPKCQASNLLTHKFCQQCSAYLPKRLLWLAGDVKNKGNSGELLAERYFVIEPSILLDTKPALLPQSPELETLQAIRPYLRLFPYRLHTPQVYGVLQLSPKQSSTELLLIEKPPLYTGDNNLKQVKLHSDLITAWSNVSAMRQLNWLLQIAKLWRPLADEGVVSSLLTSELIRVEGSLVRLLDLHIDNQFNSPRLVDLGKFWKRLVPASKPTIINLINQIIEDLIQRKISSPEELIKILYQGISIIGRSQINNITITTKTDTGPHRQRNEDACYPPSGTTLTNHPQNIAAAIICDGIGGHERGNIASEIAIQTIQRAVSEYIQSSSIKNTGSYIANMDLEKAVNNANDQISQQNDRENRQGRRRMGTTLVMGLHVGNEMYITHVGDSRAYLITLQGCYQVTLDDDVASREVCLGHTLYREATHKNDAGSLIQALGMSPSIFLNPTAQSLILDEDSVFLLCSDGLSDFDRVEENWETEILPLLMNKLEINDVADTLVRIANSYNGHDNVTVAVIHCQVKHSEPVNHINTEFVNTTPIDKSTVLRTEQQSYLSTIISERGSKQKHQAETIGNFSRRRFKMLLQLLVIFPLVIMAFMLGLSIWKIMNPYPQISIGTSKPVLFKKPRTVENLQLGWVVRTTQRTALTERKSVSTNTLLQVIDKKPGVLNSGGINIRFRVCPSSIQSSSDNDTLFWVNINQLKEAKVKVLQAGEISPCNPLPIIVVPAS